LRAGRGGGGGSGVGGLPRKGKRRLFLRGEGGGRGRRGKKIHLREAKLQGGLRNA